MVDASRMTTSQPVSTINEQAKKLVETLLEEHSAASVGQGAVKAVLLDDLKQYETYLVEAHRIFRDATNEELSLSYAAEWLLDNYYIVREATREITEDLPTGFYRRLPLLEKGPLQGLPRIYAITRTLLTYHKLRIDLASMLALLVEFQQQVPLTMGELWAFPTFLRFGLVEILAHSLHKMLAAAQGQNRLPMHEISDARLAEITRTNGETADAVASTILGLRAIGEQEWKDFFENASQVEQTLRQDPTGVYPLMDFQTRDRYRKVVEEIAFHGKIEETEVAQAALRMAGQAAKSRADGQLPQEAEAFSVAPPERFELSERIAHIGYYLIAEGRAQLESQVGYHPGRKTTFGRFLRRNASQVYIGSILVLAALLLLISWVSFPSGIGMSQQILFHVLLVIPALAITTSLVNWLVTMLTPPNRLPKIEFKEGIPDPFRAVVVVPTLATSKEEIDSLTQQLEMHYLRNPGPGLYFALLADLSDADQETLPEDEALINHGAAAVEVLNRKYAEHAGYAPFYFMMRNRQWNPAEGKWIAWERKRGKLLQFNQFLLGIKQGKPFKYVTGDLDALAGAPYVITLDADSILPSGAARRLVGTLVHPLNRAVFQVDPARPSIQRVIAGYTLLQPRMEISPRSANRTWFTRIFAGDVGLDLYSLSVSDAYQDLFGAGIYVGKGIYEVAAFERSVKGHIPENTLLSHDLLEGLMGRAALVSDITMIEDYPPNFFTHAFRLHRWIRGDWQLLPWIFHPGRFRIRLSGIDVWKILDNLRRSLLAPSLLILFVLGILFQPNLALLWTAIVLLTLSFPMLQSFTRSGLRLVGGESPLVAFRPVSLDLMRWLLAVAYLPHDAVISLDAIMRTLYRLSIRKNLLEWTTAAHSARQFNQESLATATWRRLMPSLLLGIGLAVWLVWVNPALLASAAPVLLLWMFSPQITLWLNQSSGRKQEPLTEDEKSHLRRITRRTWSFFERFAGPEDHWLPPDHFQEHPVGMVAHRTSPTNIGLLLTSSLAAFDLGYLDMLGLSARLAATFDTLQRLERQRGHFLNWYDTVTLQSLTPRYISTVDSGNLAACFVITAQACRAMHQEPIFRWALWQGYLDSLSLLHDILGQWTMTGDSPDGASPATVDASPLVKSAQQQIETMSASILAAREQSQQWYPLFRTASGPFWLELSGCLTELVGHSQSAASLDLLNGLSDVANQIERQHSTVQRTINELVSWIPLLEAPPARFSDPSYQEAFNALLQSLPYGPTLGEIRALAEPAHQHIAALRALLPSNGTGPSASHETKEISEAVTWLDDMDQAVDRAASEAGALQSGFQLLAAQADVYFQDMDFSYLYHQQRGIFHIGYNVDAGQLDNNFYDLLASEARIASLLAIAKGEAPQEHWLRLGRPITSVNGQRVLLSWSATMFEYLMPALFLRSYPRTLLDESARGAIDIQIDYARSQGVPWGISESGFYRLDANLNYQYQAFGVPGLGFKRGLADDLVIAPYASLMAVGFDARSVYRNLRNLEQHGALGLYGYYEAIDFTKDRLLIGEKQALVREYMSHHHGMVMMAMANYFNDNIMVRRMHSAPFIQSAALLLQEQIPMSAPLQNPSSGKVKGIQRVEPARVEISPWSVPVQTPIPQLHLLSNGDYNVIISNTGSGYSAWRDVDLTRWMPDRALDLHGTWLYLQEISDPDDDSLSPASSPWSATFQPIPGNPNEQQVTFFAHMAVFQRTENGIITTMEITITPDDPLEVRRVHVNNTTSRPRRLRLTTYGEVILAQQAADARHPAFNKLFIENEWREDLNLQIFRRRKRSAGEKSVYCGHMLILKEGSNQQRTLAHEANRAEFIGRLRTQRNPQALEPDRYLSGSSGATLDPIFALGEEIILPPHSSMELACLTFAGDSRDAVIDLAQRYQAWSMIDRAFHQADLSAQTWASQQHLTTPAMRAILQAFSALIYPYRPSRAPSEILAANQIGQPGLWRFGISGDHPILLVNIDDPLQMDLVREALQVHRHLVSRRILIDLVILNHQQTDYGAEMNSMLYRLVSRVNSEQWLNQRGGIFILYSDQMSKEELVLLQTSARLFLVGERGSLEMQVPGYQMQVPHLPEFTPTRPLPQEEPAEAAAQIISSSPGETAQPAAFFNGYGGFSEDGREYVMDLPPGKHTPAPWVNVIGYPEFGFLVTESGSQCTWAENSGENRLTPWSNDPVRDPTGEAMYLRDEETGQVWSPTPQPAGANQPYRVRHGAGYTIFEHESHGLVQRLALFASPEDPVKIIHLTIKNTRDSTRRITVTQFVEWVLGTTHTASLPYVLSEYDPYQGCLLATNPYNAEFGKRVAFLSTGSPIHGVTADRVEFIGRNGSMQSPAAFRRIGLETHIAPGEDPCAVLQVHLDLEPGATDEVCFTLGEGNDRAHTLALVAKYKEAGAVDAAWQRTEAFWSRLLDTIQVRLPDQAMERILNRWMLYQALSCRVWGRSAFYQSSGAFGFRDQLQDVLALMYVDPSISRGQILNAAHHQFEEGDVLHWWHPPSGRGVRTRFSDDLLWLPFVTAQYVEVSGDWDILDEQIPFRRGDLLKPGEEERYGIYPFGEQMGSLYEHCRRAIDKGATHGQHGLPLIGTGDWNDGFNKVGEKGRGESVWLAWFLIDVLNRFAVICEHRGEHLQAERYRAQAQEYARAVEQWAWDGAWYRRAYYDSGAPMGSSGDLECKIDALAQSWAVLSGAGDAARSAQAMQSVLDILVRPENRLILLFTPPFNRTPQNPGYVKGYLPGIRENGGQYTHAATWTTWAFAKLGDGERAGALFSLLNPILQADTEAKADTYRVEPYVICADIYSVQPYLRRGGWTWYTGSASWMYRLGIEGLLGFRKEGDSLRIDPVIPPEWDGFSIDYRFGESIYHIHVKNPQHLPRGAPNPPIPLIDDGQEHTVEIVLRP